jgi:hypothetical protein
MSVLPCVSSPFGQNRNHYTHGALNDKQILAVLINLIKLLISHRGKDVICKFHRRIHPIKPISE